MQMVLGIRYHENNTENMGSMSKKENVERKRYEQRSRKEIEVKSVHYGTKRLVDCMKAVIQFHRKQGIKYYSITGDEYEQER